jgi:N-acyl-D-amino-acid deacylase
MAAPFGPTEVVKELVDAGAKVNVQDYRGFTPLALAVATDRYDHQTIRLLLDHGADLAPKTKVDESALDWAYKLGDAQVITALKGTPKEAPRTVALAEHKPDIRTALGRSMSLLDQTTTRFFKTAACYACHEQTPGEFAAASLRAAGIPVDENASHERRQQIVSALSSPLQMEGPGGLGGSDNALYSIEGLVRSAYPPDRITEYVVASLALAQGSDGGWRLPGYSRSPMQDSDFSRTTIALRALKAFGTAGRKAEMTNRIARAKQWLLHGYAIILEDLDWRLVGVAAAGSNTEELRQLAAPILKGQRADGGWAQRETFTTDAYATALTLWALAESGVVSPTDEVYRKGVNYLLGTQAADGSWHVASRSTRFQQYFESGFPYEHDQWISTMATGWAINALALAVERN